MTGFDFFGKDRILGKKICIYDDGSPGPRTIMEVEIVDRSGTRKDYKIIKTSRGGFLFN